MNAATETLKKIYDAISLANRRAYKDVFMISNAVLSKNPYNNNLLKRYLCGSSTSKYPLYATAYKLLMYCVKNILHLVIYFIKFIEFSLLGPRLHPSEDRGELVLIDAPLLSEDIAKSSAFRDRYFPGLEDVLRKRGKKYVYLPLFCSSFHNKRPFELLKVLRILKRDKVPLITEYQILTPVDILRILFFIVTYPFHVISFANKIRGESDEERALKYELMDTLDHVTFYNYSRFLLGRRIAGMPYESIKVISWYENQPVNKNFYRGLRDGAGKARIRIYGAQLFLYSKNLLSIIPDENERDNGVLPDRILANGPYYLPERTGLDYIVGPSFRYAGLFGDDVKRPDRGNILVLLPYFIDDARNILRALFGAKVASQKIFIKAHPATPLERCRHLVPANAVIVNGDTVELLKTAKILVGAASGTMIEAASLGIPVISIRDDKTMEFNNPLPEYGRGIIWEYASDAESLSRQISRFEETLAARPGEIKDIAEEYKKIFFCNPTEENIVKALEL